MPIVDIVIVGEVKAGAVLSQSLADNLGNVFRTEVGNTWVRVQVIQASDYAENGVELGVVELPAFVTVLHSHIPTGDNLVSEVLAITQTVARCIGRAPERVHVTYAPAGAGRQAFGGNLVQ